MVRNFRWFYRGEFQIPSEASVLHPLMGAKDIPRCLRDMGQLAFPRCCKKSWEFPLKFKPEFLCGGPLPPSVLKGCCNTGHNSLWFCLLIFVPGWLFSLCGATPGTMLSLRFKYPKVRSWFSVPPYLPQEERGVEHWDFYLKAQMDGPLILLGVIHWGNQGLHFKKKS